MPCQHRPILEEFDFDTTIIHYACSRTFPVIEINLGLVQQNELILSILTYIHRLTLSESIQNAIRRYKIAEQMITHCESNP